MAKKEVKKKSEKELEMESLLTQVKEMEKIYISFGDIPFDHDYWKWQNRIKQLEREGISRVVE